MIKIDQKLQAKNIPASLEPDYDIIKLKDQKSIIIYKNFILINEQIMNAFQKSFKDKFSIINIPYLNIENKDIISINNKNQKTIFIGNINNASYSFNINYILDFPSNGNMKYEENYLSNYGINRYITNKTVFNDKDGNDYFSPIFDNNEIIGFFYKYKPDIDYNSFTKYYDLMSNENFINLKNLYSNNQKIMEKLQGNSKKQYFYLINKKILNAIKTEYNYKEFCDIVDKKKNIPSLKNQKKEFYTFIKTFPEPFLNKFINKSKYETKYSKDDLAPEIINVNYFDNSQKNIMIYNNFELLIKEIIEVFIKDIYKINHCYLECSIVKGKIIINYSNKLNNNKYVSSIGIIDNENTYNTEYLLIYKDYNSYYYDIQYISLKLKDYTDDSQ